MTQATPEQIELLRQLELQDFLEEHLPHKYERYWPWYPWAHKFYHSTNKKNFLCAANQISKALEYGTLIPTPNGLIPIEELSIGDCVYDMNGAKTSIIDIPFDGIDECYKVTFDDGCSVVCSQHHEWVCKGYKQRFRKTYRRGNKVWDNPEYDQWIVEDTKSILIGGNYLP